MATSKTLTPTNQTISIPELTDAPDMSVPADAIDKEADAINALGSELANGVYVSDCNNATSGNICYYADGNTANKPTGISSWLLIRVIGKSGGFITQIASEENVLNGRIWYRTKTSSTWGDWHELALNSKTTTQTSTITNGTGNVYFTRSGNTVQMLVDITPSDVSASITFAIPSGFLSNGPVYDKRNIQGSNIYTYFYANASTVTISHTTNAAIVETITYIGY